MAEIIDMGKRRPPPPDYPDQLRKLFAKYGNDRLTEAVVRLIFDDLPTHDFVVELAAALESDPRLLPRP